MHEWENEWRKRSTCVGDSWLGFLLVAISTLKDPTRLVYAVYAPHLYPIRGPGSGLYPICTPMKCPQRLLSLGMDCWWLEDLPFTLLSCPAEMVSSCQWNICHYLWPPYTTIRGHGPYLLLGLQSGTTHYQWDWKWDTYPLSTLDATLKTAILKLSSAVWLLIDPKKQNNLFRT